MRHSAPIDHPGVFASSVADAALVVEAIAGEDVEDSLSRNQPASLLDAALDYDKTPRLAFAFGPFELRTEPTTREALRAFPARLPCRVDAIELSPEFATAEATLRALICAGVAESPGPQIDAAADRVAELVVRLVKEGRALSGVDLLTAWTRRESLRRELITRMSEYDAVLTFASAGPAPPASEGTGDPIFATLWTLIGAPAYSLPLLRSADGLPIGVQAVAAPGRDVELTSAAVWLMPAGRDSKAGSYMRILIVNPNTTEAVTSLMLDAGRASASPGVEVRAITAQRGLPYITGRAEAQIGGAVALEMLAGPEANAMRRFLQPSAIRACSAPAS